MQYEFDEFPNRDELDGVEQQLRAVQVTIVLILLLLVGAWIFAGTYGHHVGNSSNSYTSQQITLVNEQIAVQISEINTTINNFFVTVNRMFGNLGKIIAGVAPPPTSLLAPPGSLYLASGSNTLWYYVAGLGWQKEIDCTQQQGPPGPTGPTGPAGPPGVNGTSPTPSGPWTSSTTYNVNNYVLYNNTIFIALTVNVNVVPGSDNGTVWMVGPSGNGLAVPTSGFYYPIVSVQTTNTNNFTTTYNSTIDPDTSSTLYAVWIDTVTIAGSKITVHSTGTYAFDVNLDYLGQLIFHASKIDLVITQTRGGSPQALYIGSYLVQQQNLDVGWSNTIYMQNGDVLDVAVQYALFAGDELSITGSMSLQQLQ